MRENYVAKFRTLAEGIVDTQEQDRFLAAAQDLENLTDLTELNIRVNDATLAVADTIPGGIF